MNETKWTPVSERLPAIDSDGYSDKVLVCYQNFNGIDICEYRVIDGKGKWYVGDMDDSPEDLGIVVLAWMPLPEPYEPKQPENGSIQCENAKSTTDRTTGDYIRQVAIDALKAIKRRWAG